MASTAPQAKRPRVADSKSTDSSLLNPVEIIGKKRDGHELSAKEIDFFVQGFHKGLVKDYQMSAWLMAVYLKGMSLQETADLTRSMAYSGTVADLSSISLPKVDKHSTGGVGDKVSIMLVPLAASLGLAVPMMSGRGLGHTGGTLDKLESIPGFNSQLPTATFIRLLQEHGCAIIGPTKDVAPVDKMIYALRDVTGTTASLPLLCSSIMSKKLAENPDSLVLDVKVGSGAFLKVFEESKALAEAMIRAGENTGKRTVALLTDMNQPLGYAVGNWLEIKESVGVLQGKGPEDLRLLVIMEVAHMLLLGGKATSIADGVAQATANLDNGKAFSKFCDMVAAQGGSTDVLKDPSKYNLSCKNTAHVLAPCDGFVSAINCLEVGLSSVSLGAGRQKVEDDIDYAAGMMFHKKLQDEVKKGDKLVTLYSNRSQDVLASVADRVQKAFTISSSPPGPPHKIFWGFMDKNGYQDWGSYASKF